jgi:hypothetical protein
MSSCFVPSVSLILASQNYVQDDFLTSDLTAGSNQETIDNFSKIADSPYVKTCVARGIRPVLAIKKGTWFPHATFGGVALTR